MPDALAGVVSRRHRRLVAGTNMEFVPRQHLRNVTSLVDVGAHVGDWAAGAMHLLEPANVILLEPTPQSAATLRARFSTDPRVTILESAAGSEPGYGTLHVFGGSDLNSMHRPNERLTDMVPTAGAVVDKVRVPVVTLDDVLRNWDSVGILKIDVQGHEGDVLAGATETLQRTTCVLIEVSFLPQYDKAPSFTTVHTLLDESGLRLAGFTRMARDSDSAVIWTDAVYVRARR